MKPNWHPRKWLEKKAAQGMRGYPVATIAFYGADSRGATKVAVSIIRGPRSVPAELRRWFVETGDVRADQTVLAEIVTFLREHEAHSVAMADTMLGCPHEEAIDYPEGGTCPQCPYWAGRNRWTGKLDAS